VGAESVEGQGPQASDQHASQPQSQGYLSVAQQRVSDTGSFLSRTSFTYMTQGREYFASAAARISSGVGQTGKVGSEPDPESAPDSAGSQQAPKWGKGYNCRQ